MQSATDTFYIALRDRLSALNPLRTMVVRGAVRPAVEAAANELVTAREPLDAFVLTWGEVAVDSSEPLPLHTMQCAVSYATRGTTLAMGMDRGRVLESMDRELRGMLQPASAAKQSFDANPASAPGTNIFWSQPRFGKVVAGDGQLARSVQVNVFALQEACD